MPQVHGTKRIQMNLLWPVFVEIIGNRRKWRLQSNRICASKCGRSIHARYQFRGNLLARPIMAGKEASTWGQTRTASAIVYREFHPVQEPSPHGYTCPGRACISRYRRPIALPWSITSQVRRHLTPGFVAQVRRMSAVKLTGMPSYEIFGKFYDAVMGDGSESAKRVSELLRVSKPDARKVLELGCGTGSILKHLQDTYEVSGLDLSSKMLSIARKKVPRAKLSRQDMVDFQIDERFDAVLCVFDSINHVRRFSDWKRVFAGVHQHLSPGGCFIFDINTQRKLERHIAEPPWVHPFGRNLLIIDVTALNHRSNWNIKVFEHVNQIRYVLHEEDIVEVSFPLGKIMGALRSYFANVRVIDPDRGRPTGKSERLFFIAKRG
jgi:SAM-dependent methyltransferase